MRQPNSRDRHRMRQARRPVRARQWRRAVITRPATAAGISQRAGRTIRAAPPAAARRRPAPSAPIAPPPSRPVSRTRPTATSRNRRAAPASRRTSGTWPVACRRPAPPGRPHASPPAASARSSSTASRHVAARALVRRPAHDEELPVGGGQRRPRRAFGQPQRQQRQDRPLQQRLHQPLDNRHRLLPRMRRHEVQTCRLEQRDRGGDRRRARPERRRRETPARRPPGRRPRRAARTRAACPASQAGSGAPVSTRAPRRTAPSPRWHRSSRRPARAPRPTPCPRSDARQAPIVAASSRAGISTDTRRLRARRRGGRRSSRALTAACAVPARRARRPTVADLHAHRQCTRQRAARRRPIARRAPRSGRRRGPGIRRVPVPTTPTSIGRAPSGHRSSRVGTCRVSTRLQRERDQQRDAPASRGSRSSGRPAHRAGAASGRRQRQCPAATICGSRKRSHAASAHAPTATRDANDAHSRRATRAAGQASIGQARAMTSGTPNSAGPSDGAVAVAAERHTGVHADDLDRETDRRPSRPPATATASRAPGQCAHAQRPSRRTPATISDRQRVARCRRAAADSAICASDRGADEQRDGMPTQVRRAPQPPSERSGRRRRARRTAGRRPGTGSAARRSTKPEAAVEPEGAGVAVRRGQQHRGCRIAAASSVSSRPSRCPRPLVLGQHVQLGQLEGVLQPLRAGVAAQRLAHQVVPPLPGRRRVAVSETHQRRRRRARQPGRRTRRCVACRRAVTARCEPGVRRVTHRLHVDVHRLVDPRGELLGRPRKYARRRRSRTARPTALFDGAVIRARDWRRPARRWVRRTGGD